MKPGAKPIVVLAGALLILMTSALLFGLPQVRRAAQIGAAARARIQIDQWARGLEAYYDAHGVMPEGDAREVLRMLRSRYDSARSSESRALVDEEAQVLDPWGTPWQVQDGERFEVRSAGPNRQFGDEDDISSLSRK